jgi:hypothetical protein
VLGVVVFHDHVLLNTDLESYSQIVLWKDVFQPEDTNYFPRIYM